MAVVIVFAQTSFAYFKKKKKYCFIYFEQINFFSAFIFRFAFNIYTRPIIRAGWEVQYQSILNLSAFLFPKLSVPFFCKCANTRQ